MIPLLGRMTPAAASAPPAGPGILGYVVVVYDNGRTRQLTCSDLMDLETAQHEAKMCRAAAIANGTGRRFQVCPVTGGAR